MPLEDESAMSEFCKRVLGSGSALKDLLGTFSSLTFSEWRVMQDLARLTELPLREMPSPEAGSGAFLKRRFVLIGSGLVVGSIRWRTGEEATRGGGSSLTQGDAGEAWFS